MVRHLIKRLKIIAAHFNATFNAIEFVVLCSAVMYFVTQWVSKGGMHQCKDNRATGDKQKGGTDIVGQDKRGHHTHADIQFVLFYCDTLYNKRKQLTRRRRTNDKSPYAKHTYQPKENCPITQNFIRHERGRKSSVIGGKETRVFRQAGPYLFSFGYIPSWHDGTGLVGACGACDAKKSLGVSDGSRPISVFQYVYRSGGIVSKSSHVARGSGGGGGRHVVVIRRHGGVGWFQEVTFLHHSRR